MKIQNQDFYLIASNLPGSDGTKEIPSGFKWFQFSCCVRNDENLYIITAAVVA